MIYFKDCHTLEQVKVRYRTLAKVFHPDCGGTNELMVKLTDEYTVVCAGILCGENLSTEETQEAVKLSEEYRRIIELLVRLSGIKIEIVGAWVWVTGNTFPVRRELKEIGLYYASKKQAWYFRPDDCKTRSSGKSLDEIRSKYGSEHIHGKPYGHTIEK